MTDTPLATAAERAIPAPRAQAGAALGDRARVVVRTLSAVTFLEWFGASVGLPLLPVYLEDRGASSLTVGLVVSAFFAAGVLLQYLSGRLVDRLGSAPVLRVGLVLAAVGGLTLALPLMPGLYGVSRFLQGAGSGAGEVAALALVGAVVPSGQHGRAFASIFGCQLAGMAIGPMLGSLVGAFSVTAVFVVAGLITLLAWIPLAMLPKELAPAAALSTPDEKGERLTHMTSVAPDRYRQARRVLIGAVVTALAFGLTFGVYETCWTLLLTGEGAANWQVGLSWTLFALPFVVATRPAGRLADTVDRRMLVVVAFTVTLACFAAYPFIKNLPALLTLGVVEAAATAVAMPAVQSLLSQGTDPRRLGRAQGTFATAQTGATAVAAGVSGVLFSVRSWLPFVSGAVLGVLLVASLPTIWATVHGKATSC